MRVHLLCLWPVHVPSSHMRAHRLPKQQKSLHERTDRNKRVAGGRLQNTSCGGAFDALRLQFTRSSHKQCRWLDAGNRLESVDALSKCLCERMTLRCFEGGEKSVGGLILAMRCSQNDRNERLLVVAHADKVVQ